MFAYCRNNPVIRIDCFGLSDGKCTRSKGSNEENIRKFFGLDEDDELPELEDGCMLLLDNIMVIPLAGPFAVVRGHCVLMDYDKYCEYYYWGLSASYSLIPFDYQEVKGYVYGVEDVDDYSGLFFGASESNAVDCKGGSIAFNGVTVIIIGGEALSSSIGCSATYFAALYDDWQYGKVNIQWHESRANEVINRRTGEYVI